MQPDHSGTDISRAAPINANLSKMNLSGADLAEVGFGKTNDWWGNAYRPQSLSGGRGYRDHRVWPQDCHCRPQADSANCGLAESERHTRYSQNGKATPYVLYGRYKSVIKRKFLKPKDRWMNH
jgi:hypothetical protein